MNDYNVTVRIKTEIYDRWKKFAAEKNVRSIGTKASITDFTSKHVSDMMEKILREEGYEN